MILDFRLSTILDTTSELLEDDPGLRLFEDVRQPPGKEHYFLLASLGTQLSEKAILELGTHTGNSAYVLAYGNRKHDRKNTIVTYDIQKKPIVMVDEANVSYRYDNLLDPEVREHNKAHILSSDILFIDIDPHEGVLEYDMYQWLLTNDYQGIVLFDDIHLQAGHMNVTSGNSMAQFWKKVDSRYVVDLTPVGHWSGTGLVCFHPELHTILTDE